jgi:ribose-phosphate pyrophosphokinase
MIRINSEKIKVFLGSSNPSMGTMICKHLGISPACGEVLRFSEGNTMVRVLESVRGTDAYIIQGISHPVNDNFVELLFWIDALKMAGAAQVTAVIPFFSYAKGDKKDEPRASIRAKVTADAVIAAGADNIIIMDLHSPQTLGFFKKPVDHLYAMQSLCDYFLAKNIPDLVVASVDVGFAKSAFQYSEILGAPVVIGNKIRVDHSENAKIWSVVGDVSGKNVLIVDDIIFTGSSLIAMAEAVKEMGALDVYAAVSHGVFTKGAAKKIESSLFKEVIITDTIEKHFEDLPSKVKIASVGKAFAGAIASIHTTSPIYR